MVREVVDLGLHFLSRERLSDDRLKQAVVDMALGLAQSGVREKTEDNDKYTVFASDNNGHFFRIEVYPEFPLADGQFFFITKLGLDDLDREKLSLVRGSNRLTVSYEDKKGHVSQRWRKFAEDFLGSQFDLGKTEGYWYWVNDVSRDQVTNGDLFIEYPATSREPILRLVK